jgi:hypothetical protein
MVTTCGALFVLFCITCPGLAQQSAPSAVRQDNINALDPGSSAQSMRRDFYKSFLKPVKSAHETQPGNLSVPFSPCTAEGGSTTRPATSLH